MALQQLDNKYNSYAHNNESFISRVAGFFKTATDVDENSLEVNIDSSGVKLDMASLLRNERVTRQISETLKNINTK
jgi:hypothetical protein